MRIKTAIGGVAERSLTNEARPSGSERTVRETQDGEGKIYGDPTREIPIGYGSGSDDALADGIADEAPVG